MSDPVRTADADAALLASRHATQEIPSRECPEAGIPAQHALRLASEDLALDIDPARLEQVRSLPNAPTTGLHTGNPSTGDRV